MLDEIIRWILSVILAIALFAVLWFLMVAIMTWPQIGLVLGLLLFIVIFSRMIHDDLP